MSAYPVIFSGLDKLDEEKEVALLKRMKKEVNYDNFPVMFTSHMLYCFVFPQLSPKIGFQLYNPQTQAHFFTVNLNIYSSFLGSSYISLAHHLMDCTGWLEIEPFHTSYSAIPWRVLKFKQGYWINGISRYVGNFEKKGYNEWGVRDKVLRKRLQGYFKK
jgi:hypothetical protein